MSLILSAFKCYRYMKRVRKGVQNELSFFNKSMIDLKRSYWPQILAPYLKLIFHTILLYSSNGNGIRRWFLPGLQDIIKKSNCDYLTWMLWWEKSWTRWLWRWDAGRWKVRIPKVKDGIWKMEDGRWKMRSRKMEGKDPQEGGWSTETGLWPHLIPLEYQTYPAANK